ncbi:MAG: Carboxyl-terminal protease [Candidatus Woesebacteria bacterium GW2011_GWA1_41_13b]|uniref:Carboxyl-terminal protease n=1 Tax=Candidatus Woesebacteria bacterium GW2011_GWA1_41_13b TaxID=1618555 RepID=A0A0G0X2Z5_9BACT|nr:MAG: Carboxyl-terminal protease [Candidatus Woesebacteria bacterium GW2011_GWA1_41_13b]
MRKNFWIVVFLVLAAYGGFLTGEGKLKWSFANYKPAVIYNRETPRNLNADFAMFWQVWDKLNEQYVDKTALDPEKMVDGAISGMVGSLDDPYTVYLPPQQNKEAKDDLNGAFEGVGIQLGFKEKALSVVTPIAGTPADKAGVKSGDLILHIKDEIKKIDKDTTGMTLPEAVNIIRGKKGTEVELTLGREGEEKPMVLKLQRETIVIKSATVEIQGGVAILKLNKFGDRTQEEWTTAVDEVVSKNVKGVVLDMRFNPGGYLDGAVWIAGEFLPAGKLVVSQQYGDGTKTDNKVSRIGRLLKTPLVVVVNEGSASAAEILAGALRDHNRAKIVGVKTFGKGSVQQPEDFDNGAGIHITVARWLRPNGEWIDKKGIEPDTKVEEDDKQLQSAIKLLK